MNTSVHLNTFFERDQRELVPGYIEQEAREEESAAHKQGLWGFECFRDRSAATDDGWMNNGENVCNRFSQEQ